MHQQLIIELLGLLGKKEVSFNELVVRPSPTAMPQKITMVMIDNRSVFAEVNGKMAEYNTLPLRIRQAIGQRLRAMF